MVRGEIDVRDCLISQLFIRGRTKLEVGKTRRKLKRNRVVRIKANLLGTKLPIDATLVARGIINQDTMSTKLERRMDRVALTMCSILMHQKDNRTGRGLDKTGTGTDRDISNDIVTHTHNVHTASGMSV